MNIGFDAKRAFHNNTGLGVFSRVLIGLLTKYFPEHDYYLFNPKPGNLFTSNKLNVHEIQPNKPLHRLLSSAWRSKWVIKDLIANNIDLYHGLSHEIPAGIHRTGIPSIVTMHDMFPEIYPQNYKPLDVKIYRTKTRYACKNATRVMAISEETKRHIVNMYKIDAGRIDVIYQSFDPAFAVMQDSVVKEKVRNKYRLPNHYFLHVGSIIERKNLLNICKAMQMIRNEIDIPLVVVGRGGAYKERVKAYIHEKDLGQRIIFLQDQIQANGWPTNVEWQDLPAIYQMATAMIYPSFYEGFGLPIAEAMAGGVPVITSNTSCMPEVGGNAAFYVDPARFEEMAEGLKKIYGDAGYASSMAEKGLDQMKAFSPEKYVTAVIDMYESVLGIKS